MTPMSIQLPNETDGCKSSQILYNGQLRRARRALAAGSAGGVSGLCRARRVGRSIESDPESDEEPFRARDPTDGRPRKEIHQCRPRGEKQAEERPDRRTEGEVDPVPEQPRRDDRETRPESQEKEKEATHSAGR